MIPSWGVSTGSLVNFSQRCFLALDVALSHLLKWPNAMERHLIQLEFAKLGFFDCAGLIDGSLLPLSQRPKEHGECYFDRKSKYSINAQVVCDHMTKILFVFTGMPGSCQDLTCFKKLPLATRMDDGTIFSDGQYLLGDSAYVAGTHMVAAFNKSQNSQQKEEFNMCVAKCRVTNEH